MGIVKYQQSLSCKRQTTYEQDNTQNKKEKANTF